MKVYMVWYRMKEDEIDRVRGVALNWQKAERMAENLEMDLKSRNIMPAAVGVKRGHHGTLYADEDCSLRWSVIPPETSGEDNE